MPDGATGPLLAVSMGEPAGIGTEILLKVWRELSALPPERGTPVFFVIDDPVRIERVIRSVGADIPVTTIAKAERAASVFHSALPVLPLGPEASASLEGVTLGHPSSDSAPAVIESIERAVRAALDGRADGVVTLPVQKEPLAAAGFPHPGHTEFLAALTAGGTAADGLERGAVMMIAAGPFRVVPVTIHLPLKDVPGQLTPEMIVTTGTIVAESLHTEFGIAQPRLAVAGLNPHAGEGGRIGKEDQQVVAPAIASLRERGINAFGPLPADTMFHEEARAQYDAAICMYHDQALIPIKTVAFHEAVNLTLGLPIVRTSPDHGTALPIAGKGVARADSLLGAILEAGRMAMTRRANQAHA